MTNTLYKQAHFLKGELRMRRTLIAATLQPHLAFVQALKSVAHGKHLVALGDSHPDGGSHSGVHARRGGAHVQHSHVEGALRVMEGSWSHTDKHTRERRAITNAHTAEGAGLGGRLQDGHALPTR